MRWEGDGIISEGLDREAAQEVLEKKLLSRLNKVLMAEGYILLYAYDPGRMKDPAGLVAITVERYVPKDSEEKRLGAVSG
jgi:hypothetical protein